MNVALRAVIGGLVGAGIGLAMYKFVGCRTGACPLTANPYVAMFLPELPAVMLTYDFYDRAEASAVQALAGEAPITGRLPVTLPGMFPVGHGLTR